MGEAFLQAVSVLGQGFLTHASNRALRRKLSAGSLTAHAYRDELVILTYRLILSLAIRDQRELPRQIVSGAWRDVALPTLSGCRLADRTLQAVLGQLRSTADAESLAAAHEELLAAEPAVDVSVRQFDARGATGAGRKHSGSYYTPAALVAALLDSALEPVVEAAITQAHQAGDSEKRRRKLAEEALLELRICDPACGGGVFLIAAARRLARRLVDLRGGEALRPSHTPPDPPLLRGGSARAAASDRAQAAASACVQADERGSAESLPGYARALRDVVVNCVFGADLSRTAVELCRLSLQLELVGAGVRSLPELEHNITCGNSLLGTAAGVAPGAFDVVLGNPPYRAMVTAAERAELRERYPLAAPTSNSAAEFVELCTRLIRPDGRVGLVVPKSLTYSYSWRKLRAALSPRVLAAVDVGRGWDDVLLEQVLLTFSTAQRPRTPLRVGVLRNGEALSRSVPRSLIDRLGILPTGLSRDELRLLDCMLHNSSEMLGTVCTTQRGTGLQRSLRAEGDVPVIAGRDIRAFEPLRPRVFVGRTEDAAERVRWTQPSQAIFQNIIAHVTRPVDHIRLIGTLARERVACLDTVNLLTLHDTTLTPAGLCGLLMSDLVAWFVYAGVYNKAIRTMHFDGYFLAKIPLPRAEAFEAIGAAAERLLDDPAEREQWQQLNDLVAEAFRVPARLRPVSRPRCR